MKAPLSKATDSNSNNSPRIFITGGASGLGKATALKFAQQGYRVCIADINEQRGQQVLTELLAFGNDAFYLNCDVSKLNALEEAKKNLLSRWQGVDIVINNAGIGGTVGGIDSVSLSAWDEVLNINLMGVVRGCKVFTELFKQQQSGYFINISSAAGLINAPNMSAYNVSKAGVIALSETLLYELKASNIGVSVICPAFFKTNLTESIKSTHSSAAAQDKAKAGLEYLMNKSGISADNVADAIFDGYQKQQFLVITHQYERRLWLLKRYLPIHFMQKLMLKKLSKVAR
jgi:NAD(P)-dependent dehydrogenase (short-subunit alcohol dehydrogenase family)